MSLHVVSNVVVVLLLAGALWLVRLVRRRPLWREAARNVWRRRPVALTVIGIYVLIALLDSVAWTGGRRSPGSRSSRTT